MICKNLVFIITMAFVLGTWHSGTASAAGIDFYGIDISVKDAAVSAKLIITFDSKIEAFVLPLGKLKTAPKITTVSANKGSITCGQITTELAKQAIECNIRNPPEGRNTAVLNLEYPANFIEVVGDKNIVEVVYEAPKNTTSLSVSFVLPERAVLSEDPPQNSVSPRNGDIKTDGKKIFVFWGKQNITEGESLGFTASFTLPGQQKESPVNAFLILPIIIILAVFVWFAVKSKKKARQAGETGMVSVLSKEEKALFDILKVNGGQANQKVLVRESNFSKAKVSRLLRAMKERGIIGIEPISGRENRVILTTGQQKKENEKQPSAVQPESAKNEENKNNTNTAI